MIEKVKQLPEFELLVSLPGIGEISAALFIGEIGDLTRFSNNKKVNAFIGIDIRGYQSGKYAGQDTLISEEIQKEGKSYTSLSEI